MIRSSRARRVAGVAGAALVVFALPASVLAHGTAGRIGPPLEPILVGFGLVAATIASIAFAVRRFGRGRSGTVAEHRVPGWLVWLLKGLGLVAWAWIVAQAVVGGTSDAEVAALFLWIYGWIGVGLLSALLGPVWQLIDPFTSIHDLITGALRRTGLKITADTAYPEWLGAWPAVVGLVVFVWLDTAFEDFGLGIVLIAYTALTVYLMTQFGRDTWRANGEVFGVWFAQLNRLAPFEGVDSDARIWRRRPVGSGLFVREWTPALVAVLAVGTGSIVLDAVSQTPTWVNVFGASSSMAPLVFLGLVLVAALVAVQVAGIASVGAALVPLAVGLLIGHYLPYLLVEGQRIVVALSDPLQVGSDLLGTAFYEPSAAWLVPGLLWSIQLAPIVGGQAVTAWAASASGPSAPGDAVRSLVASVALGLVLVAVTLWALGQPIVVS